MKLCELESSLDYTMRSITVMAVTPRNPVATKQNNNSSNNKRNLQENEAKDVTKQFTRQGKAKQPTEI